MKPCNTFIVHPESKEQENALKAFIKALNIRFEIAYQQPYDANFVAHVQESRLQAKSGKTTTVRKDNLDELLGE